MKTNTNLQNHEIFHVCTYCHTEFDRRFHQSQCPACGHTIAEAMAKTMRSGLIYPAFILIVLLLMGTSCSTTKMTYRVRNHQTRMLQEVIQSQSSISSGKDWTRQYRNWDRRPHGKWPFQFIQ